MHPLYVAFTSKRVILSRGHQFFHPLQLCHYNIKANYQIISTCANCNTETATDLSHTHRESSLNFVIATTMAAMSITKNAILNLSKSLPRTSSIFLRRNGSFFYPSKTIPRTTSLVIRHKISHVCFSSSPNHSEVLFNFFFSSF